MPEQRNLCARRLDHRRKGAHGGLREEVAENACVAVCTEQSRKVGENLEEAVRVRTETGRNLVLGSQVANVDDFSLRANKRVPENARDERAIGKLDHRATTGLDDIAGRVHDAAADSHVIHVAAENHHGNRCCNGPLRRAVVRGSVGKQTRGHALGKDAGVEQDTQEADKLGKRAESRQRQ